MFIAPTKRFIASYIAIIIWHFVTEDVNHTVNFTCKCQLVGNVYFKVSKLCRPTTRNPRPLYQYGWLRDIALRHGTLVPSRFVFIYHNWLRVVSSWTNIWQFHLKFNFQIYKAYLNAHLYRQSFYSSPQHYHPALLPPRSTTTLLLIRRPCVVHS